MKRAPIVAALTMLVCLLVCLAVAPLAFAGAPECVPTSILAGQASAAEAAALKATLAPAAGRALSAPSLENDYVSVVVGSDGRFRMETTGGDPQNPNDDYQRLLFGTSVPWSSYTTIRIDGADYIFGSNYPEETADGMRDTFYTYAATVQVDQILTLVPGQYPGRNDTVRIEYRVTALWASGAAPEVGVRIMLDTMLGSNDGAPFRVPGVGPVTTEVEYDGDAVPDYWRAFDSLENPTVSAQGTLRVTGTQLPDRLVLAHWPGVYGPWSGSSWDYSVDPSQTVTGDSAVCMYWNPQPVSVGGTRQIATQYGIGESTPVSGAKPVVVLISGLNSETVDDKGACKPDSGWSRLISQLTPEYDVLVASTHKGGPAPVIDSQSSDWDKSARLLDGEIRKFSGNRPVILIGHSMGGLIARAYAENWRNPECHSGAEPLAVIQLGTPNGGSPAAAVDFLLQGAKGHLSSAAAALATPEYMAWFNATHGNTQGVPIYRVGGSYFLVPAAWEHDWNPFRVAEQLIALTLNGDLYRGVPNDMCVTTPSLMSGPWLGWAGYWEFPAVHGKDDLLTGLWPRAGSLEPFSRPGADADAATRDASVDRCVLQCVAQAAKQGNGGWSVRQAVSAGRLTATTGAKPGQALAAAEQAPSDMDTAPGWTTCVARSVSLTGGAAVTTFTVEGALASITVAADSGEVSFDVKNASGVAVPCTTTTQDGVTEGTIGNVMPGDYTLTVTTASGSPTKAEMRIEDTGPSSLRLLTPGQVEAGKPFTVKAAVYGMGGTSDVPTFARNTKALSMNATGEGSAPVSLRDDGVAPDETAGDGIYTGTLTAPSSGSLSSFAVTASGEGGAGVDFVRQARAAVAIAEPRATLPGPVGYRLQTDASGKVTDLLVDVPVDASQASSLGVAIDVSSGGTLIAQSATDGEFAAGDSKIVTVTVPMTSLYAGLAEDGSFAVSRVVLNDYTDDMPTLLDEKTNVASGSIPRADIAYSSCSASLTGPNPTVSSEVTVTGDAVCTTEPISVVEYSLDEGVDWSVVPAPAGGWGGHTESWQLPLHLADGSYAIIFRVRGSSGPIAGAEAYVSFAVDTVSPYGTFILAGGAATTLSTSVTADATVGNLTAPIDMRFSCDFGTTWSAWETFSEHTTLTLPGGLGQKTAYVQYRDANSKVLELNHSIELLTAPTLTSFSPASGLVGTSVTITGTGLTGATSVSFNGVAAAAPVVLSDAQLTATVPAGATSGTLSVTTPAGTATSASSFTVIPAPAISGFTPASGPVGTSVTISGSGLTGATSVSFNGVAAAAPIVLSDTQLTATVPSGATTGTIAVTTPAGTATSATSFTVVFTPTVTLTLSGPKSGSLKLGKSVTASGAVTPTSLAGSQVTLTAQLKKGARWIKAKTFSALISSTGAYSSAFAPAKKGSYRLQGAISKTATHSAATTKWLTFGVK